MSAVPRLLLHFTSYHLRAKWDQQAGRGGRGQGLAPSGTIFNGLLAEFHKNNCREGKHRVYQESTGSIATGDMCGVDVMTRTSDVETVEIVAFEDPFAKHFGPSPPPVAVMLGAMTHPGRVRPNNEDHFVVIERRRTRRVLLTNLPEGFLPRADDAGYVMAVADGLGGAAFGELASMLALRSGWEQAPSTIKWTWIVNDKEVEEFRERLEITFRRMDQALLQRAREQPECKGMATTLTGAYTIGPEAFIGHVGDSRAYLFHQGKLVQLTRDHTLAQDCLDRGFPVLARSWHHKLTNCLGGDDRELHVEFHHFRVEDGDQLMLCTDGLSDMISDKEIAAILSLGGPPMETAKALVDLVLERGARDNVTVILAQYRMVPPTGGQAEDKQ
jgi:PPM family protein phosphatase